MRNSKKIIGMLLFVILCLLINGMLTFAFYPYNYARIDVHNMETKEYDTVFLGSSHGKCSINPLVYDAITKEKSINLCMGGEYMQDVYFLTKEITRNHKPKQIIYELDPGYWVTKPAQGTDFASFYDEFPLSTVKAQYFWEKIMKGDFRSTLFPWYVYRQYLSRIPENIQTKTSDIYKTYDPAPFVNEAQSYQEAGFIYRNKIDAPKPEENLILWEEENLQQDTVDYFYRLMDFCKKNNMQLTVITTPVPEETYKKYQENYDQANQYFSQYFDKLAIPYYDFNQIKLSGLNRSLDAYADYEGHMYGDTAEVFTKGLAEYFINVSSTSQRS
jgi:hypothetical protein